MEPMTTRNMLYKMPTAGCSCYNSLSSVEFMCGVSQASLMFNSEEFLPCKTHYDNVSFHFDCLHECSIHRNNGYTVNITHQCTLKVVINTSGYVQISPQ